MMGTARQIHKDAGIKGFYKGVQYSCTGSCSEKFIYFYAYNYLRKFAEQMQGGGSLSTTLNLLVGSLADFTHLPLTQPLDTVLMRLKSDTTGASARQIFARCLEDTGIMGFYKGVPAYLLLCWKPSIQFTVFEQVSNLLSTPSCASTNHNTNR